MKWLRAVALILALAATVAWILYRRDNPATLRLQPALESLGVSLLWATLLVGAGILKIRSQPSLDSMVTYFNEAWNPQVVDRAGLFLGWLVDRGRLSPEWADDSNAALFGRREITGRELLEDWGDKIVSEMLDDIGNAFTLDYFASSSDYWEDCEELLASGEGARSDPWADFAAVRERVDRRFAAWNARRLESTIDRRARRILFTAYWDSSGWRIPREEPSPEDAAYAREVGYLFDDEVVRHDEAIKTARKAMEACSLDSLVDAFVASLSHRWLHLRAGLPCFYIASRMSPHGFDSAGTCPLCGLFDSNSIDFGAANFARHKWGAFPTTFAPENGFILERVSKELGWVEAPVTNDDQRLLRLLLEAAATQKPDARAADLANAWQGLLPSNAQERNILLESFVAIGVLVPSRTSAEDRRRIPPRSNWSAEAALWRGDDGVHESRAQEVFGRHLPPTT